jgi:hypothetical protein
MRRFTTEPLTDADLRECYGRLCMSSGKKLILNPETLGNFEPMTLNKINFPKDASVKHCAKSRWMSYS